jgi:D-serine deaminase-like pyridoxal phosphate-dependent protein
LRRFRSIGLPSIDFATIRTPFLVLDRARLEKNCKRMTSLARTHGVSLRPHLKTAKSADVAAIAVSGNTGGIAVSTIAEADYFFSRGYRDMLYGVALSPQKVAAIAALQRRGASMLVLVDSRAGVDLVGKAAGSSDTTLSILVELDSGGGRSGVGADDAREINAIADAIQNCAALKFVGFLSHAGHAYTKNAEDASAAADDETSAVQRAGALLAKRGMPAALLSVGSTPSVSHARSFEGITELRVGTYMFGDVQQFALGTCAFDDIAVSVIATVIGHNYRSNRLIIDAGALALSLDHSAEKWVPGAGYGVLVDLNDPSVRLGLSVIEMSQEHGRVGAPNGSLPYDRFPIGSLVRIFPGHVCHTVAPYDRYYVTSGDTAIIDTWDKASGW